MQPEVGSREYHKINYKENCIISGESYLNPLVFLEATKTIMIRSDLAVFCYEFLNYKINLSKSEDIAIRWSDSSDYSIKVYRDKLEKDISATYNILNSFQSNFLLADTPKVSY